MTMIQQRRMRWMMEDAGTRYGKLRKSKVLSSASGCLKCPGYCCKAFWLPNDNKGAWVDYLNKLRGYMERWSKASARFTRKQVFGQFKTQRFIINNFVKVINPADDKERWFTCKQFDAELGRCTCYHTRPRLCKIFTCEGAKKGPTAALVRSHFQDRAAWGKEVLKRRRSHGSRPSKSRE